MLNFTRVPRLSVERNARYRTFSPLVSRIDTVWIETNEFWQSFPVLKSDFTRTRWRLGNSTANYGCACAVRVPHGPLVRRLCLPLSTDSAPLRRRDECLLFGFTRITRMSVETNARYRIFARLATRIDTIWIETEGFWYSFRGLRTDFTRTRWRLVLVPGEWLRMRGTLPAKVLLRVVLFGRSFSNSKFKYIIRFIDTFITLLMFKNTYYRRICDDSSR